MNVMTRNSVAEPPRLNYREDQRQESARGRGVRLPGLEKTEMPHRRSGPPMNEPGGHRPG